MNRRLFSAFAALIIVIVMAGCTFSLEPVNALDMDAIANANTGLIKITNNSGKPLVAVRIIHPDEAFTEHRYDPALPGAAPDNFREHRFPAGVTYRVKFQTSEGWTTNAKSGLLIKGQTFEFFFEATDEITPDTVEKGKLTVWNKIPMESGEYIIVEIRVSCGEAGQETEVFYYEKDIKPGEKHDFLEVPAARYRVRARIRKTGTEAPSKWSVPALAGLADGSVPAGAGEEITVSAALAGVAVFKENVLLPDGSVNAPLQEVSNLTVKQGEGKLTLEWQDPDDEDVYQVEISCTDTAGKSMSQTVLKNKETAVLAGLENGESYNIRVKTVDRSGNKSDGVGKLVVMGSDTPPAEVTGLAAAASGNLVRLTWTDPTDADFDHIEISYSADSGLIQTLPPVAKGVQGKLIESLNYGTIYAFTVKTVDTSGNKSQGAVALASMDKVVNDRDLSPYVTAPVLGMAPSYHRIAAIQYTGTVDWKRDGIGYTMGSTFEADKAYLATVTLTANPGYTFSGVPANSFSHTEAQSAANVADGTVVTIVFPPVTPVWYVTASGADSRDGSSMADAVHSVQKAVALIYDKYAIAAPSSPVWPGKGTSPITATIIVSGLTGDTGTITIDDHGASDWYPPIAIRGLSTGLAEGIIDGQNSHRVLEILNGAEVTLGKDITIRRGKVTDLVGAGVYVRYNSILTMTGGIITNNVIAGTTRHGAGVCLEDDSSFTMTGGTITDNTAAHAAGGVAIVRGSTFTLKGGTISNNKAFTTGGVLVDTLCSFTMEGGSIVNNEAADLGGGLLVNYGSDATMTGGTISYNKAGTQGGGVAVREESAGIKSSFIMQGGTISYNTAVAGSGGGLLLGGITSVSGLTITIEGGTISNNSAKLSGGGICVTQGLLTIKGGTIAANTAELSGGGVYILNADGAIKKQASGGIIYGYTPINPNSNKVTDPALRVKTNKGHAVYIEGGSKKRETTVGIGAALDSSALDNATGGWTE